MLKKKSTKIKSGMIFNRLTAIEYAGRKDNGRNLFWIFECECGNKKEIRLTDVVNGRAKSCGCLKKETGYKARHGQASNGMPTSEYKTWSSMIYRCTNPDAENYYNYGGRGIEVCFHWLISFEQFFEDMGPKPGPEYSIDRIDNDKGYYKSNCRWATRLEQVLNRRPYKHTKLKKIIIKIQ